MIHQELVTIVIGLVFLFPGELGAEESLSDVSKLGGCQNGNRSAMGKVAQL